MLSAVMLDVAFIYFYAECHYGKCRYAESCGATDAT
jgi:hypothetical protein